jgi:multiple sugar transport system substrate-binding protein
MRHPKFVSLLLTALLLALATGVGAKHASAWSLEDAAKPYDGATITVLCEGYPACYAMQDFSEKFTERTGINVTFEIGDLLQISQRILTDQLTGTAFFDASQIQFFHLALFGEQGWATPLKTFMDDPNLRDPSLNPEDFVQANLNLCCIYKDELLAFPFYYIPGFPIMRKDFLAHSQERADFKTRYGYELPPAELIIELDSWQQWLDMAEFFTRKKGETLAGQALDHDSYGIGIPFQRHLAAFWVYWELVIAHGGEIIDQDHNVKLGEGTAALDALNFMLEMTKFAPASYPEYNWDNQYIDFCEGTLFSTPSWADTIFYLEEAADCASATNISYASFPGIHTTVPFAGSLVIPSTAPHPEAAYLYLQWALSKDVQAEMGLIGWIPNRRDVVRMDWADNQNLNGSMKMHVKLEDIGWLAEIPHHPSMIAVQDIMMEELSAAGAGEIDAETAVENMVTRVQGVIRKE